MIECVCVCVWIPIFRIDNHSTWSTDNKSVISIFKVSRQQQLLIASIQLHHMNWSIITVCPVHFPAGCKILLLTNTSKELLFKLELYSVPLTCPPSPLPGLQLLLNFQSQAFPCLCHQNAFAQFFLPLCPTSRASSHCDRNLTPPHWIAPAGLYSIVTRLWLDSWCSSGYCTAGTGQCHCSDDRYVHLVRECTLERICSGTSQPCSHRSGCKQQGCWHTRLSPRRLCHQAWDGSLGCTSSNNQWECQCKVERTYGQPG